MQSFEAYRLASRLHAGQVDKAGRPYIEHLARVFVRVQALGGDSIQQIAALLHDAIEDGRATAEQLKWAGVPTAAVDLVVVLSKKKEESYADYLKRVKAAPRAILVKWADLADNGDPSRLARLSDADAKRLSKKYAQASKILAAEESMATSEHLRQKA